LRCTLSLVHASANGSQRLFGSFKFNLKFTHIVLCFFRLAIITFEFYLSFFPSSLSPPRKKIKLEMKQIEVCLQRQQKKSLHLKIYLNLMALLNVSARERGQSVGLALYLWESLKIHASFLKAVSPPRHTAII
jgi:hypothetical protein